MLNIYSIYSGYKDKRQSLLTFMVTVLWIKEWSLLFFYCIILVGLIRFNTAKESGIPSQKCHQHGNSCESRGVAWSAMETIQTAGMNGQNLKKGEGL